MKHAPSSVVYGGLDWYGFDVTQDNNRFTISEGIVGRSDNPITLDENNQPSGGWTFEGAVIETRSSDQEVDVIFYHNEVCLLIRSDDPNEVFPEELDIMFSLMRREGEDWVVYYPWRDRQYGKDSQRKKCDSDHSGTIKFL